MSDAEDLDLSRISLVYTKPDLAAGFAEPLISAAKPLEGLEFKFVVRPAGSSMDYHGAPPGKAVVVVILAGNVDVFVGGAGSEEKRSFGPGEAIIFQDDFDKDAPPGAQMGHRSAVVSSSAVLQMVIVLPQRFVVVQP